MHQTNRGLYIASSLLNADRVRRLRDRFRSQGVYLTYDWTEHCYVDTFEEAGRMAGLEAEGVARAACLLLVLPARLGSHFEAGIAFGMRIPIVLLEDDGVTDRPVVSFHHHPRLLRCGTEDLAVRAVLEIMSKSDVPSACTVDTAQ